METRIAFREHVITAVGLEYAFTTQRGITEAWRQYRPDNSSQWLDDPERASHGFGTTLEAALADLLGRERGSS